MSELWTKRTNQLIIAIFVVCLIQEDVHPVQVLVFESRRPILHLDAVRTTRFDELSEESARRF